MSKAKSPRIIVVGTGFAGICMGIRLKQAGIDSFTVFEKASSIGGTWRDNDYPGAACDVQSHLYSFSFAPNPRWSRMFAGQREIHQYLDHCVDRYGLRSHIRFDAPVTAAHFDEAANAWKITVGEGEEREELWADIVIAGTGFLSRPAYPKILGLDRFQGKLFHSARWDHGHELEGKTVAVIGTGASSIQFVPQIAPRVKKLRLFQRTPPWVLPKPDRRISGFEQWLFRVLPFLQWLYRIVIYWLLELRALGFVVNPKLMALPERLAREFLEKSVSDPTLRAKLTPSYTIGCKRVLISNDYYPALVRANVDVVDVGIREVTETGVVTADGQHHEADTLILGTGFQASESVAPFVVRGPGGVDLDEHWQGGAEAYLGTAIAGFPNFFMIVGPNTGLGHSSMVFMIESQVAHVMSCIRAMQKRGAASLVVRSDVQRRYNDQLQENLKRSVWSSGCASWYQTRSGKITTLWPGFTFTFRRLARRMRAAEYRFDDIAPRP